MKFSHLPNTPGRPWRQTGTLVVATLIFLQSAVLFAKAKPAVDSEYPAALAVGNRFLTAWLSHDQETGVILLSNSAKQHSTEERLQAFFTRGVAEQAFEIAHGRKLSAGRYSFPVSLFGTAGKSRSTPPRHVQLLVVRVGRDDWAIDKLP